MNTKRTVWGTVGILMLSAGFAGIAAPTANAAILDLHCTGTTTSTYNPPLTNQPKSTEVTEKTKLTCKSTDPTLTSGSNENSPTVVLSCTSLLLNTTIPQTFHWNNGRSTTADVAFHSAFVNGNLVATGNGSVTAGEFIGETMVVTLVTSQAALTQCLTTGLSQTTTRDTVDVTPL